MVLDLRRQLPDHPRLMFSHLSPDSTLLHALIPSSKPNQIIARPLTLSEIRIFIQTAKEVVPESQLTRDLIARVKQEIDTL